MKRQLLTFFVTILCMVTTIALGEKKNDLRWLKNYNKAVKLAKKRKKMLFIGCFAEWGGPCKRMDETFADEKVIEAMEDMVLLKIDIDKDQEISKKFDVRVVPTFLIFDSSNEMIDRDTGYMDVDTFLQKLKGIKEGVGTFKALKESFEKNPNDPDVAYQLFDRYLRTGDIKNAKALIGNIKRLDPENKKGYFSEMILKQGTLASVERDYDTAIKMYDEFLERYPQDEKVESAMYFKGSLYAEKGETDKAIKIFKEFKEKYPNSKRMKKVDTILKELEKPKDEEEKEEKKEEESS